MHTHTHTHTHTLTNSIAVSDSLNYVEVSITPPQPAALIVDRQRIGPAQLVGDEGGRDVLAIQTHAANVGGAAPVAPVQEAEKKNI